MKTHSIIIGLAAFSLIALTNGCSKQEPAAPPVSEAPKAPAPATESISAAAADAQKTAANAEKAAADALAQKQAEAEKALQAEKTALADKAAQAQNQATNASAGVQALIDTAKRLAGENKWSEVLNILSQLSAQNLNETQQATVNALKTEAEKHAQSAATDKAAGAAGGLLNPKK
jgi:pilus assembly protein FimV